MTVGGIESQILQLLPLYEKNRDLKISIVTKYSEYKPVSNRLRVYEIRKFNNLKLDTVYFIIKSFFKIIEIHKKEHIDLLNIHQFYNIVISPFLIRLIFKIPILMKIPLDFISYEFGILYSRNYSIFYRVLNYCWLKIFKNILLQKVDYIRALNDKIYNDLIELNYPRNRILKVPNGINFKNFINIRKRVHEKTHFAYVGRLIEFKNIRFLLNVINEYFKLYNSDKFFFYGVGPEKKYIKNFIKENNLNKNIFICGFEKNKRKIYSNIDVLIDPAFGQGISNANLEAMCTDTFLIASNTPGNRDLVDHQKTGLLFNPKDYKDLMNQLIYYKKNKEKRDEIVRNAKDRIIRDFNIDRIAEKIIKFIIKRSN